MIEDPNYKICSKLVLDTSYPGITFDENGICNFFYDFHQHVKPNWYREEGKSLLLDIVKKVKEDGKNRDFDCVIGLSGGLDSSFMLHEMVTKYNIRPLVFHVDGGWNSELAVSNINNLIDKLNLDLFTEVIDWQEMKEFQLAMFKSGVPHLDIPQDMAFVSVLYKFANRYKVKYIFNGGNISTECVPRPLDLIYWGTDMLHIKDILDQFSSKKLVNYPFSSAFYHKFYLRFFKGVKVFKPLNYMRYNRLDSIQTLSNLYNWKPYSQKHFESRFTRFFEGYWLLKRFNFDMRRIDLSSLILTEQLSRDEALKILEEPPLTIDDALRDFRYVASKLEISESELNDFEEMEKKFFYDYKNNNKLFGLGEKILSVLTGTRRGGAF